MSEAPDSTVTADPSGQRSISPVADRLGRRRAGGLILILGLGLGCGVLVLTSSWPRPGAPRTAAQAPARQVVAYEPAAPRLEAPGANPPSLTGPPQTPSLTPVPALEPATSASGGPPPQAAPLIAYRSPGSAAAPAPAGAAPSVPNPPATELETLRRGSAIKLAKAARLPDRNFLILAGASLPCVLQTALSSATPGYVSCLIPHDVRSESGAVVLLEKGTRVLGEYRSSLRQGQGRMFVLWTRAVTPAGVAVALASPATDPLGRAGFSGQIDTHFWDRFGAALLLSLIEDGGAQRRQAEASDAGAAPSEAASVALGATVNIAPTLEVAQGAQVSIFVAQDLDFSDVYGLAPR